MRIIIIALAGLLTVGAVGGAAVALMPTTDSTPLDSIRVEAPQSVDPLPTPRAPTQDFRGVPQPPPPVDRPPVSDDHWDDDGDGDGGDDDDGDDGDDD